MNTNSEFDDRRNKAVARAVGYTSTFTAARAENAGYGMLKISVISIFAVVLVARTWGTGIRK